MFLGEGNGNLLQYSCLENPMERSLKGCSPWGHKESDTTEATQHACLRMYVVGIRDSNFWGRPGSFISGKVFLGPINEGQRQVRAPEGVSQLVHTGCTSTSQVHRVPQQRRHVHASHILHSFPISSLIDTLTSEC